MVSAGVNITTGLLTQQWSMAWWVSLGVLLVLILVGAVLHLALSRASGETDASARRSPSRAADIPGTINNKVEMRGISAGGDVIGQQTNYDERSSE